MDYLIVSIITIILLLLGVSIYYNLKFGRIIIQVQDDIEECLDVLDGRYKSISEILNIPVFFDSVEVRRVIQDIEKCKTSILYVADRLSSIDQRTDAENIDGTT